MFKVDYKEEKLEFKFDPYKIEEEWLRETILENELDRVKSKKKTGVGIDEVTKLLL